jgi:ABC-2 type transport system permease protein
MSLSPSADAHSPDGLPALERSFDFSALAALFWLTLRQQARGRRLIVLALLFALPAALAVLVRSFSRGVSEDVLQTTLIFYLIPQALAPLAALLYATGAIQDEVEEQTLTYLLVRPLPRAALYVTKLLAALVTTSLLAAAGTTVVYVAVYWGTPQLWGDVLPGRVAKAAALFALAQVGYCSVFGIISLITRQSLIAGVAYIVAIEGILANWPFILRELTVMYYFRVLVLRWLGPQHTEPWAITLSEAPTAATCVQTLTYVGVILILLGGMIFARREFGVKTPEAAT